MTAINKENSKVFLLTLLGMLSAFGPFVTDMYLPSLPAMADYFSASLPMVGTDNQYDRAGTGTNLFWSAE